MIIGSNVVNIKNIKQRNTHGQSRPCPWRSHYKLYNGLDCILGSRPTHIRLYAPADRRIDMRPNPI